MLSLVLCYVHFDCFPVDCWMTDPTKADLMCSTPQPGLIQHGKHWKLRIFVMPTFWSSVALQVVKSWQSWHHEDSRFSMKSNQPGQMTHSVNWVIIGSDNGLVPYRWQTIIWINAAIWSQLHLKEHITVKCIYFVTYKNQHTYTKKLQFRKHFQMGSDRIFVYKNNFLLRWNFYWILCLMVQFETIYLIKTYLTRMTHQPEAALHEVLPYTITQFIHMLTRKST